MDAARPASLADVPFSLFCAALRDLRAARARKRRGRASNIHEDFRRAAAGLADAGGEGAEAESKHDVLTRFWKEVAGRIRNVEAERGGGWGADGAGEDEDGDGDVVMGAGAGEEVEYPQRTALSVGDTVVLLSMLCPNLDEAHSLYMMKEKKVAKHYREALSLPEFSADGKWLLNWADKAYRPDPVRERNLHKRRAYAHAQDGVFVSVLMAVLVNRAAAKSDPSLSVLRVWELLGLLYANADTGGSRYSARRGGRYGAEEPGDKAAALIVRGKPGGGGVGRGGEGEETEAGRSATGKKKVRIAVFREMLQRATAAENAEFVRIVLKDTEVRLREDQLLRWYAGPDAKKHYDSTHDLRRLVLDFSDLSFSMESVGIEPGCFASVMLTARPTKSNLTNLARGLATGAVSGGDPYFLIEPKLDGERMQLHKIGSEVVTFTRNRKNSSEMYASLLGEVVAAGVQAEDCILDGEIMLWDGTTRKWVSFESMRPTVVQMNTRTVPAGERYTLKYCVFDVLYIKQKSEGAGRKAEEAAALLLPPELQSSSQPVQSQTAGKQKAKKRTNNALIKYQLTLRKKLLRDIVKDVSTEHADGFCTGIEVVETVRGRTESDLINGLASYVQRGYEGLVAKSPTSDYGLNERDKAKAIKLKPDYFEGGLQDIDVVILGAKYGTGTGQRKGRHGTLSSFLIGVRSDNSEGPMQPYQSDKEMKWTPIGSIGTGYSVEELAVLQRRLEPHWQDIPSHGGRDRFPGFWDAATQSDTMFTGVVKWIHPRNSAVLQVRAYELARRQGYALRFPRCDRIRDPAEKPFYDAISLEELIELDDCKTAAVVASSGGKDEDEVVEEAPAEKKRKKMNLEAQAIAELRKEKFTVTSTGGGGKQTDKLYSAPDISGIKKQDRSDALTQRCFRVFASPNQGDEKQQLERRLYRLGAELNQNPTAATDYMAVDAECAFVQRACKAVQEGRSTWTHSIIRPGWLDECELQNTAVPLHRKHVFFASKHLEARLSLHADIYGDRWTAPTTKDSFIASMVEMDEMADRGQLPRSVPDTDTDIENSVADGMRAAGAIFWGVSVYFPPFHPSDDSNLEAFTDERKGVDSKLKASHESEAGKFALRAFEGARILIRFFGGKVVTEFQSNVKGCYLVLHDPTPVAEQDAATSRMREASGRNDFICVSDTWVQTCVDECRLVPPFVNSSST